MSKVYDCFIFNGEFELLEIRLKTHFDAVDFFVIAEGDKTFHGADKEYFTFFRLPENLLCYREKIRLIRFETPIFGETEGSWLVYALQRDSMLCGLYDCDNDDFVIFSDTDEILRPEKIREAMELLNFGLESVIFNQDTFCYYLNVKDSNNWEGPRMLKFDTILKKKLTPQIIVNDDYFDRKNSITLFESGWHFQNLGGPKRVVKKLQSSCHHETNDEKCSNLDIITEKVRNLIEPLERSEHKLRVVDIDETFPKCIYQEQEKYKDLIHE